MAGDAVKQQLELADVQGLVVRGYGGLPHAAFVLLAVEQPDRGAATLRRWAHAVTAADRSPDDFAVNLAFTAPGVAVLTGGSLPLGFSEQFLSGMTEPHRSRILGDLDGDAPPHWDWGGPTTTPVHVLLLAFARTETELDSRSSALMADSGGLRVVRRLSTAEVTEREAFGFHDGISQPFIEGLPRSQDARDVVRAGEFLLGYLNEHDQLTERPLVPAGTDPAGILPPAADSPGEHDLGRNGSYLVFRQLHQDVEAFHRYAEQAAGADPSTGGAGVLAAKMVGRWPGGAPLVLAPEHDDPDLANANDFGYFHTDPEGFACPVGAHIRRANPRDSLAPDPGTAASQAINRRHRLIRRGRNYVVTSADGTAERGIHFLCVNANIARQYEFVQHTWLGDPCFNGLDDASDPVVGARLGGTGATFTEQAWPVRRRHRGLPQFVSVRGGAYFFLPGIRALRYLTSTEDGSR
jgi:Dyp-type peroxidase family